MASDAKETRSRPQNITGKLFLQDFSYVRLGEKAGKKEIGNSWIWKDKYN
jgi:hypothetical protein